jgi:predicted acylesterase/phospholipase RssA
MIKIIKTALVCGLGQASELYKDEKCRVLALRGGGNKGAYEVGALKAFITVLDPKEIAYDVVEGVSIGGLNAAGLALYPKGQEKEAVEQLN